MTLTYADEWFRFGVMAEQNNTNRADISSGTSVLFHVYLRNLGGIHTDSGGGPINFPAQFRQY